MLVCTSVRTSAGQHPLLTPHLFGLAQNRASAVVPALLYQCHVPAVAGGAEADGVPELLLALRHAAVVKGQLLAWQEGGRGGEREH